MSECKEDRFLSDVTSHKMTVIRDDGVDRHIRFRNPDTISYGFDLITWPGHLCITGDCGTYVFQRLEDMFEFFRVGEEYAVSHPERKLFINAGYWGEKLLSIGTNAGFKKFDDQSFRERVKNYFEDYRESEELSTNEADELWSEIVDAVFSEANNGEHQAYQAIYEFKHNEFRFDDFFDGGGTERYTFHYLWCLYGIAWGILQYDTVLAKAA